MSYDFIGILPTLPYSYIGSGAQGWIERVTLDGKTYAVKFSIKHPDPTIGYTTALREYHMIKKFDESPHIIQAYSFYPNVKRYSPNTKKEEDVSAMVMEYAPHGDLFTQVQKGIFGCPRNKKTALLKLLKSESYARIMFRQLLEAVETCHSQRICHLDIKLENILLDKDWNVKLTDFGFSRECDESGQIMTITGGTYAFSPPEYIAVDSKGNYKINSTPDFKYDGTKVDIFNMGIALFILLTGVLPWEDALNPTDWYYTKMRKNFANFWLDIDKFAWITDSAKDLLTGMLFPNYKKRFTIEQIKTSEWFNTVNKTYAHESLKLEFEIKPVNLQAQFDAVASQGRKRGSRKRGSRKRGSHKRSLRKRGILKLIRH